MEYNLQPFKLPETGDDGQQIFRGRPRAVPMRTEILPCIPDTFLPEMSTAPPPAPQSTSNLSASLSTRVPDNRRLRTSSCSTAERKTGAGLRPKVNSRPGPILTLWGRHLHSLRLDKGLCPFQSGRWLPGMLQTGEKNLAGNVGTAEAVDCSKLGDLS